MKANAETASNFLGLSFLVASDQFITMSMAQVLQIPVARPVFMREVANRMYSTSAYYLASSTASMFSFFIYPLVVTLVSFYFFKLDNHSFSDMLAS